MSVALKGVPVAEASPPPGVANVGGEWYYNEYADGSGVASLGLEEVPPVEPAAVEEERKGILDLFKR